MDVQFIKEKTEQTNEYMKNWPMNWWTNGQKN